MKSILVTGGCGFIGSSFIRYLFEETDFSGKICNLDSLTYAGNPLTLKDIQAKYPDRYCLEVASICESEKVTQIIQEQAIDTIVHFAAESHVDRSIASPDAFIETNIRGTYTLLEAVRHASHSVHFHHVSTDEVFGSLGEEGFFTEETAYAPNSPYSASKAASDHLVRAYHETYGVKTTLSNCSNNYGPYHFPEKLIPLMILNALEGRKLPVYGDGMHVRDWLYVRDHCRAIWSILCDGGSGEVYTVGGKNELPNLHVVQKIVALVDELADPLPTGSRESLIEFVKDRPGHDRRYAIDCSKIERELGWSPEESFDSGLRKTVAWYLQNSEWVGQVRSGDYRNWIADQYGG